ncbi:MAG: rhodanese-like domain-containing protein [Bacteroidetes bacterium]|nr:MAG: rhodanese-like domain-containing protein [Bacteroidota bacterium]
MFSKNCLLSCPLVESDWGNGVARSPFINWSAPMRKFEITCINRKSVAMFKINFIVLLMLAATAANAQFKSDNVKYTTVFPEELCKTLMASQGYTVLDVRSQGEVDDTSTSESLNIGRVKDAIHIDIRQLPQRWRELLAYKDKPLFIYCSHSQRSRRASRLLADSGFTRIYNINGGLTNFYNQGIESSPCAGLEIVTNVPYKILSSKEFAANVSHGKSYYIIDLRSDSVFKGISIESAKTQGKFNDAVNVPFDNLLGSASFSFPSKPILLVDDFGNTSPKAAKLLMEKGYKDVSILFDGMDGWVDYATNAPGKPVVKWTTFINYNLLPAEDFNKMVNEKKEFALIDVRTKEEFNNTSKNYWQNIGQVKSAVNIPSAELNTSSSLPKSKDTPIVIYGFNAQNGIFESAKWLKDQGYKNVSVLQGGIWSLRWTAHNIKGKTYLNDLVVNVPAENE